MKIVFNSFRKGGKIMLQSLMKENESTGGNKQLKCVVLETSGSLVLRDQKNQ